MNAPVPLYEKSTKRFEGLRLKKYRCSAGCWTIGWGHNLDVRPLPYQLVDLMKADGHDDWESEGITLQIAAILFEIDAGIAIDDCCKIFSCFNGLTEIQRCVLFDMAFHLGSGGLRSFKNLIKAVNSEKLEEVPFHILDSKYATEDTPARARTNAAMWARGEYLEVS